MCGQAEVGGQGIMPCPSAAKLEHDVWVLMQRIQQYQAENKRLRKVVEMALYHLRETIPDPCACWGASGCDAHELIADLEEVVGD